MDVVSIRPWGCAVLSIVMARPALAAASGNEEAGGWVILFLAFGALVIAFQAIPALLLFGSMLKGLLFPARRRAQAAGESQESSSG